MPLAKFSIIAEHVWLLERTGAREKFLVFGNDREVPVLWTHKPSYDTDHLYGLGQGELA